MTDETLQLKLVRVRRAGVEDQSIPVSVLVSALQPDPPARITFGSEPESEAIRGVQGGQQPRSSGEDANVGREG